MMARQAKAVPVRPCPPRQPNSTRSPPRAAFQQRSQGSDDWGGIIGHSEVGPVDVIVGPRRIPLRVEIQTKVGSLVAGIGIPCVKRNGGDPGPVGEHHDGSVEVQIESLMIVVRDSALWRFIVHVPVDLALRAHDYGSDVRHAFILVWADCSTPPRQLRCRLAPMGGGCPDLQTSIPQGFPREGSGIHSGVDVVGAVVKVMGELSGQSPSSGFGESTLSSTWCSSHRVTVAVPETRRLGRHLALEPSNR